MRCFEVEVEAKVAQVRLCRPDELNSMVPEFWRELPELVRRLSDDGGVRAVVLSSTGRHFSAGMDLGVFAAGNHDPAGEPGRVNANRQLLVRRLQESFTVLERARMPVLAAIQGGCVGGAIDLVTACDMRYATEDAFFVVQETNIGMTADVGTLQRLPKIIPDGVARELVYTGRRMPAARAYQVGLVNQRLCRSRRAARRGHRDRGRDCGAEPARDVGQQGDARLHAGPLGGRRAAPRRRVADRRIPAGRHGRGLHRQGRETPPDVPGPAPRPGGLESHPA